MKKEKLKVRRISLVMEYTYVPYSSLLTLMNELSYALSLKRDGYYRIFFNSDYDARICMVVKRNKIRKKKVKE